MGKRYKSEKSFKFLEDGFHGGQKKKASKHASPLGRRQHYSDNDPSELLSVVPSRFIQKIV